MTVSKVDLTQRLAGKVAVITGAASGIGLAAARRMHAEGATIVVGDIDPKAGTPVAKDLGQQSVRHGRRHLRIGGHRLQ